MTILLFSSLLIDMTAAAEQSVIALANHVHSLIIHRNAATLIELQQALGGLREQVARHPNRIGWPDDFEPVSEFLMLRNHLESLWPELGFYDLDTGGLMQDVTTEIGDALDDLVDIANDLSHALQLAERETAGALDWLRFHLETHWGPHLDDLDRHLAFLIQQP